MVYAECLVAAASLVKTERTDVNRVIEIANQFMARALEVGLEVGVAKDDRPSTQPEPDANPPSLDRWLELLRAAGVVLHMNELQSYTGAKRLADAYTNLTLKEPRFYA